MEVIRKGKFREDLYYRLSQHTIRTEALKDRPQDVILLANHFVFGEDESKSKDKPLKIDPKVKIILYTCDLSDGNVRDLQRYIGHADDYEYVKREILIKWTRKMNINIDTSLPLTNKMLNKIIGDSLDKQIRDRKQRPKSMEELVELVGSPDQYRIPDAILFLEKYKNDYNYKNIVTAYEITILKSYTKLSNHDIADKLHILKDLITEKGFREKFGLSLNIPSDVDGFNYIYPDFFGYWDKCHKIKHGFDWYPNDPSWVK